MEEAALRERPRESKSHNWFVTCTSPRGWVIPRWRVSLCCMWRGWRAGEGQRKRVKVRERKRKKNKMKRDEVTCHLDKFDRRCGFMLATSLSKRRQLTARTKRIDRWKMKDVKGKKYFVRTKAERLWYYRTKNIFNTYIHTYII